MRTIDCGVAIIGAGTAGLKAYKAATATGQHAVLIERGPGGSTCTRNGCMPSKLLIAAGRAAEHARRAGLFGIRTGPVEIDGPAVLARLRAERDRFVASVLDDYHAVPDDCRIQGAARFTGPGTLAVGGDLRVTARAIIIATGATPQVPKSLAPVADLVRTHETIFEIEALPRALAVLGAGPLGLELAQAFARLGVAVTLLDEGNRVGALQDPEAEAAAREAMAAAFDLHLGAKVTARRAGDGRATLDWTGDSQGSVTVDLVLAATGRRPSLEGLDLDKAGVALDDKGVPCFSEETHRAGDGAVHIAGDADDWRPVLHEAARGGGTAGRCAAIGGGGDPVLPALAIAFTEPALVTVGTRFAALPDGAVTSSVAVADNGRARVDGQDHGVVRLYADRGGALIGATIVADEGEHLGHLVALGIARGITADQLADQAWYHPTLAEMLQDGARQLAAQLE